MPLAYDIFRFVSGPLIAAKGETEMIDEIVGRAVRRHSTAAVLLHHVIGERLGLGPSDLNCLHLLRERGAMTGSDLVAITGLTSGAITGVVARLERAGFLRRDPDPDDRRKQNLTPTLERMPDIHAVFEPLHQDLTTLLKGFDAHQLTAILEFLTHATTLSYRQMALLRSEVVATEDQQQLPSHNVPDKG